MSGAPSAAELSQRRGARFAAMRQAMAQQGVDCLLLSLGAELPWCTGYEAMPLERPTVLVMTAEASATLVVPALEAGRVRPDETLFRLCPWNDAQDPIALLADLIGPRRSLAISDTAQARLVLELQRSIPNATWRRSSSVIGALRAVKDPTEVAALRTAASAADEVATALVSGEIALIGRSEKEVSDEIGRRLLAAGHAKVNFAIVGSGPNAASPHHEAGARVIGRGETVVCDFGGTLHVGEDIGYCSDITRTVVTGEPVAEIRDLYDVLQEAQQQAVAAVRPGVTCASIDAAGRNRIDRAGYGEFFMHRIGHGIGAEAHEDPYLVAGNDTTLRVGHTFSVEPGIYLAGRFGARIEDIVVVTDDGVESLNRVDHGLQVIES